jgi:large subunit ribosomal protein L15
MPLQRRLPKRGFTSINKKDYNLINLRDLDCFDADTTISLELYGKAGLVKKMKDGIKILADGELSRALTVQAHKFSRAAVEKIEAAGGKAEVI